MCRQGLFCQNPKQSSCSYLKKSPFILLFLDLEPSSFLFTSETLMQLVNMLIRDDKYFCQKTDNLPLLIQFFFLEKRKDCCFVFIKFMKCTLII